MGGKLSWLFIVFCSPTHTNRPKLDSHEEPKRAKTKKKKMLTEDIGEILI